jgi:hypothetical protein
MRPVWSGANVGHSHTLSLRTRFLLSLSPRAANVSQLFEPAHLDPTRCALCSISRGVRNRVALLLE